VEEGVVSPSPPTTSDYVTLHICQRAKDTPAAISWSMAIRPALDRLRKNGVFPQFQIDEPTDPSCFEKLAVDETCHGDLGNIYCDGTVLARMLHATSWMAAGSSLRADSTLDHGCSPTRNMLQVWDALQLADASEAQRIDEISKILVLRVGARPGGGALTGSVIMILMPNAIYRVEKPRTGPADPMDPTAPGHAWDPSQPSMQLANRLYRATIDHILAFVVGHELWHGLGECPFKDPSSVEADGTFDGIAKLQATALSEGPPASNELLADQCGLRAVEKTAALTDAAFWKEPVNQLWAPDGGAARYGPALFAALGRRIAVDMLGWLLSVGLRAKGDDVAQVAGEAAYFDGGYHALEDAGLPQETDCGAAPAKGVPDALSVKIIRSKGYLNAALRVGLFATALRTAEREYLPIVGICDDTAQLLRGTLEASMGRDGGAPVTGPVGTELARLLGRVMPRQLASEWAGDAGAPSGAPGASALSCGAEDPITRRTFKVLAPPPIVRGGKK
jgi:hypothetical protein